MVIQNVKVVMKMTHAQFIVTTITNFKVTLKFFAKEVCGKIKMQSRLLPNVEI